MISAGLLLCIWSEKSVVCFLKNFLAWPDSIYIGS